MQNNLKDFMQSVVNAQKSELVERLVSFVCGDTILYLPDNLLAEQCLKEANNLFGASFQMCRNFDTADINIKEKDKVFSYLNNLAKMKLAGLYLYATELRSVLLGVLLIEKKINLDDAFSCSFAEELTEQEKWGKLDEIIQRHAEIKIKLESVEEFVNA